MAEQSKDSPQVAITWMILAGLCFSATGVFVKLSGGLLIAWTVIFGRSAGIAIMTFILAKLQEKSLLFEEPKADFGYLEPNPTKTDSLTDLKQYIIENVQ